MSLKDSGEKLLKLGPYGTENGGKSFDDGIHSTVRQLVICYDSSNISFIQIEYDDNGRSFWSDKHGGQKKDDDYFDTIQLDYPDEYLTSVHGKYVKIWLLPTYISSLTFRSNKKCYGPYGDEGGMGKYFSIQAPGNKIVGFHGRTSMLMDIRAIGAYLKPLEKYNPSKLVDDSVVPVLRDLSNPLLPARYPKPIKKPDEEDSKKLSRIISDNQVARNEGDRNGGFAVGNKFINAYYYYSKTFKEMYN